MLEKVPHLPVLLTLRESFLKHGRDIRIVGGSVRDILQNRVPDDVDLATDATPEEQETIYKAEGIHHVATGLAHGTWLAVIYENDKPITFEITSLRVDTEQDGRHAKVVYIRDWLLDLSRRDLTINSMSLTLDGELIDPYNGADDLANKRVVFVGNPEHRIHEDYLRILRWFRFSGRYSETLDSDTSQTICVLAPGLKKISRERVWAEVSKIISGPNAAYIMYSLSIAVGEYIDLPNTMPDFVKDHPFFIGQTLTKNPVYLMKYFLVEDEEVNKVAQAWKWSNEEKRQAKLFSSVMDITTLDQAQERIVRGVRKDEMIEMLIAWGHGQLVLDLTTWTVPVMPFGAVDIMATGIPQGPEVGKRFDIMRERWISSKYMLTKEELFESE